MHDIDVWANYTVATRTPDRETNQMTACCLSLTSLPSAACCLPTMSTIGSHNITFNHSTLNDVQGNYYNYNTPPGERGK